MPVAYEDYDDEDDSPVKEERAPKSSSAPSLEDEEAFPDFGGGAAAPTNAPNFMAAWSSSKAPTSMPEVVSRPKKRAPAASSEGTTVATASFGSAAKTESAPAQYTGAGVPWSDSEWSRADKTAHWTSKTTSTMFEQARASCKHVKDPYAAQKAFSTVPTAKAPQAVEDKKVKAKSAPAEAAADAAPVRKQREPEAPKKKDAEGFTEVAKFVKEEKPKEKKEKKEKKGAKAVGTTSAYAALDDPVDNDKENAEGSNNKKKNRKEQKQEKQEEVKQANDVQVDTRPKKKKGKDKKKDADDDFVMPSEKKAGKQKGGKGQKGGATSDPEANMMMGLVGAAAVAVAGVFYFLSTGSQ